MAKTITLTDLEEALVYAALMAYEVPDDLEDEAQEAQEALRQDLVNRLDDAR